MKSNLTFEEKYNAIKRDSLHDGVLVTDVTTVFELDMILLAPELTNVCLGHRKRNLFTGIYGQKNV